MLILMHCNTRTPDDPVCSLSERSNLFGILTSVQNSAVWEFVYSCGCSMAVMETSGSKLAALGWKLWGISMFQALMRPH
jgi:hypothetical protein